jgi:signal transduction histidine kinase
MLSRADSGAVGARAEPFDLAAVAAGACHGRSTRNVRVALELSKVTAHGDPILTRRILENLVDNAVRHAAASVEVRVCSGAGVVAVSVADDGPGLSGAVRSRLFGRFNREPGPTRGAGLGLAIAHALTVAQGGRLALDESTASGTRFVMQLPSEPQCDESDPPASERAGA